MSRGWRCLEASFRGLKYLMLLESDSRAAAGLLPRPSRSWVPHLHPSSVSTTGPSEDLGPCPMCLLPWHLGKCP